MKNTYFVTCPLCGSNLDPGERCDCEKGRLKHDENMQDLQNELKSEERTVKEMTSSEKAKETRKRHEEARKAKDLAKTEIQEKMKESCLRILDDPSASSADRIKAVEILHDLTKGW